LTKEEFIESYCSRSGVSALFMQEAGQVVVECCCGEDGCPGWVYVIAAVAEGLEE
jgi:hypothetical protein